MGCGNAVLWHSETSAREPIMFKVTSNPRCGSLHLMCLHVLGQWPSTIDAGRYLKLREVAGLPSLLQSRRWRKDFEAKEEL